MPQDELHFPSGFGALPDSNPLGLPAIPPPSGSILDLRSSTPESLMEMPVAEATVRVLELNEGSSPRCSERLFIPLVESGYIERISREEYDKRRNQLAAVLPDMPPDLSISELLDVLGEEIEARRNEAACVPGGFQGMVARIFGKDQAPTFAIDELEAAQDLCGTLSDFVEVGGAYLRLTDSGQEMAAELKARAELPNNTTFDVFLFRWAKESAVIQSRLESMSSWYDRLVSCGFDGDVDAASLWECSAALALLEDSDELAQKASYFAEKLLQEDYTPECSLDILRALARRDGLPAEIWRRYTQMLDYIVKEKEWTETEDTLVQAALMLAVPGQSLEEKYKYYDLVDECLYDRGWVSEDYEVEICHLGVQLASFGQEPEILCDRHFLYEGQIANRNEATTDSELAALVMMQSELGPKSLGDRFWKINEHMEGHGWENGEDESYDIAKAIMALHPEDPAVIVSRVDNIYHRIEDLSGSGGITTIAAIIATGIEPPFDFRKLIGE